MYLAKSHNIYFVKRILTSISCIFGGGFFVAAWIISVGFSVIVAAALVGAI